MNHVQNIQMLKAAGPYDWLKSKYSGISNYGHAALDTAGMVPLFGNVADLANAAWYGGEAAANYNRAASLAGMGMSGLAALPGIGLGATAGKYGAKALMKGVKGNTKYLKKAPGLAGRTIAKNKRTAVTDFGTNMGINALAEGGQRYAVNKQFDQAEQLLKDKLNSGETISPELVEYYQSLQGAKDDTLATDFIPGVNMVRRYLREDLSDTPGGFDHKGYASQMNQGIGGMFTGLKNKVFGKETDWTSLYPGLAAAALGLGVALT